MPATASASSLVTRTSRVEHGAPGRPFRVGSDGLPLLPCHESPSSLAFLSAEPLPATTSHFGSVTTREDVRMELETRYRQSQQLSTLSEATLRIDTELEMLRRSCFAQRNAQWGDVTPDQFEFQPVLSSTWTPQPANTKLLLRKMRMEGALEGREFFPREQKTEDALEFVRDRPWPPREFALKPVTKPSRGRGGKRKAAPMAAVMDPVPLLAKTCRECRTQSTPLWRTQTRSVKVTKPVVEDAATNLANAFVAQGMAQIAPQTVKMQEVEQKVEVDLCLKCYLKLERADLFDKKRVEKRRQERRKKEQAAAAAQLEKKRLKHQIHLLKKQQKEQDKLAMQDGVASETMGEQALEDNAPHGAVILKFTREEIEAATASSKERKRDRKHSRKDKKKKKKHRRRHEVLEDSEDEGPTPIPSPAQMNGFVYADRAPAPYSTPQTSAFEGEQVNPARQAEAMTIDTSPNAFDNGLGSQAFGYEEAASTPARSSSRKRKSVQRTELGVLVEPHASSSKKRKASASSSQTPRSRRATESVSPAPAVVALLSPSSVKKRARTKKELARERELRALGQYCPVCNEVYEDDDQNTFVCCDSCELWVHGACDPSLTPAIIAAMANTDDKYICPLCGGRRRDRPHTKSNYVKMEGKSEMPSSSYTDAVEAALAMAAAYETKKARCCKPKKRKKVPLAPPLVINEPKKLQQKRKETGLELKETQKGTPRPREMPDRRPCSSRPDARTKSRPPRRSDSWEDPHRQKTTQKRRTTGAGSHGKSRPSPEVVELLSSSSSSGSSVGSRSRSSSVSSLSSLSSLTSSSDGEGEKKRFIHYGEVLSRDGKLAGRESSTERDRYTLTATICGGNPKGSLPLMRQESTGDSSRLKRRRKIATKQAAVKSTQPSHPLVQKSTEALSTSTNSSSPASPPKLLQARKSVAIPSTTSIQGYEENLDAFGRSRCHKAASPGSTTSGDANLTLPSSAYAAEVPSPPSKKRRVSSFFNTDKVSLTELQAQERELAWIRSQRNQRQNRFRTLKTANAKHPDADSRHDADDVSFSDGTARYDNHRNQPNKELKVLTDGVNSSGMSAYKSICHPTSYRGVFLDEAPSNLLPVPGCTAPFESDCDRPLTSYDETGTLTSQCSFLQNFGKPSQCISSVFPGMAVKSQSDVTHSVSAVVTAHLPIIRRCYRRKVRGILKEAREKIAKYKAALEKLKPDHDPGVKWHVLPRSPVEKCAVRQLKSGQRSNSLNTRRVSFRIGRGDGIVQEKVAPLLIQVNHLKEIQPLRKYTTSIGLRANYRVEDNPFLHCAASSSPIGGTRGCENDEKYGLRIGSVADEEVIEFVLRLVVGRLGDSGQVFHALKSELGFSQAYTAYSELKKLHDLQQQALIRLRRVKELVSAGESERRPDVAAIVRLMELSSLSCRSTIRTKSLSQRMQPPVHDLESNIVDSLVDNSAKSKAALGLRATSVFNELVHVYGASLCRMCYSYACQEHGGDHPHPARRVDPVYPRVVSLSGFELCAEDEVVSTEVEVEVEHLSSKVIDTARPDHGAIASCGSRGGHDTNDIVRQETRRSLIQEAVPECNNMKNDVGMVDSTDAFWRCDSKALADPSEIFNASHIPQVAAKMQIFLSTDSHCSQQCWKITDRSGPMADQVSISPSELGLIRKLRDIMGDSSCLLAAVMGSVSCSQLHELLQKHQNGAGDRHGRHLRKWKQGQRANRSNHELVVRTRNQRLQDRGSATHEYVPCMHEGTCDSTDCTCMQRDHMCEKACACSRDCPNRFEGCKCSPGQCRTAACPCFAALRECDADVCLACGAAELAVAFRRNAAMRSRRMVLPCGNVNVTHRSHQRLGMSFSSIHGYGMYAREAIAANAFVYEYSGAMISQDEAERRGRIYDKKDMSYLFDLNEDAVLDALRRGNKSKFINHNGDGPNCTAKVVSVCGAHHITIWAVRDIAVGEELVFDYGYKRGVGPDWSHHQAVLNESS